MEEREIHSCPLSDECRLIQDNKDRMPELILRMEESFCRNDYSQCARQWLADKLNSSVVPALMIPNQWEWARQIFEDYQSNIMQSTEDNTEGALSDTSASF